MFETRCLIGLVLTSIVAGCFGPSAVGVEITPAGDTTGDSASAESTDGTVPDDGETGATDDTTGGADADVCTLGASRVGTCVIE